MRLRGGRRFDDGFLSERRRVRWQHALAAAILGLAAIQFESTSYAQAEPPQVDARRARTIPDADFLERSPLRHLLHKLHLGGSALFRWWWNAYCDAFPRDPRCG